MSIARHDHARRAEAALQAVVLVEGLLHRVELSPLGEPLDGDAPRRRRPGAASMVQDLTATPSTWTTQAPHCDVSQPIWVPVRPSFSRRSSTSSVRSSTSAETLLAVHGHARLRTLSLPYPVHPFSATADRITMTTISASRPHICGPPRTPRAAATSSRSSTASAVTSGSSMTSATSAVSPLSSATAPGAAAGGASDVGGEGGEELVGHLLGGGIDQAGADLGELAADLGLGGVGEQRPVAVGGERHVGAALGEAGDAALALAGDGVAVGRIDVGERDVAVEGRLDRADLGLDGRRHLGVGDLLQRLAAGNRRLEHGGIVERGPDLLPARRESGISPDISMVGGSWSVGCASLSWFRCVCGNGRAPRAAAAL